MALSLPIQSLMLKLPRISSTLQKTTLQLMFSTISASRSLLRMKKGSLRFKKLRRLLQRKRHIKYNNRVYVRGHKYVLGPTQIHFSPRLAARAKMSLRRAQNIFMPKNINSITINITLEGTEKIKTKKKWQQNSLKNIFFTSAVRKRQQTLKWLLDFDWLLRSYDYLILIFYWFISAG